MPSVTCGPPVLNRLRSLACITMLALIVPASAQEADVESAPSEEIATEQTSGLSTLRFINPRARIALPEPMPGPVLRFVVNDDFPPFAFIDGAGRLAGAHIDLIRGVCTTLNIPCTLQARRFDQVLAAVEEDPDNLVLAAGIAVSDDTAEELSFSLPYYRFAGRFMSLKTTENSPDWVDRAQIGVVENTAHAAFLRAAYADASVQIFRNARAMYGALRRNEISHAFADGVDLALWMASDRSSDCCAFVGQPIFSLTYFGEGLAFAVPRGQPQLVQALNAALARLESSGELEAIMLTAFPLDPLGL